MSEVDEAAMLGRRGRPLRAGLPSVPVPVRLTSDERAVVRRAADANHQNVAQFMRDALLTAAEDCLEGIS